MAKVLLDKGDVYVAASTVTILGNTGSETVKIQDGVTVTVDGSVERIEFSRASLAYTYKTTPTGMQVLYNNSTVANVVGGQKLSFTDGSASVLLGTFDPVKLIAPITLGGVTISSTASSITPTLNMAADEISTLTPIPTAATPTFSVTSGATSVIENGTIDFTVALANRTAGSAYGVNVALTGTNGATIGSAETDAGVLALNTVSLAAGYTYNAGVLTVPSTIAGTTASAVFTIAVNSDSSTPETGEGLSLALTNATGASAIVSANAGSATTTIIDVPTTTNLSSSLTTGTGTSSVDTFNIAAGTYSATIAGFAVGDKLKFFSNAAITVTPDSNQTDGIQVLVAADAATSAITTLTLTGLTAAQDNDVFNFGSFNTVFGAGAIV